MVGTEDPHLDDTLFMAARWSAAGNDATLEVVAEAPHGFTGFPITVAERELIRQYEFVAEAIRRAGPRRPDHAGRATRAGPAAARRRQGPARQAPSG